MLLMPFHHHVRSLGRASLMRVFSFACVLSVLVALGEGTALIRNGGAAIPVFWLLAGAIAFLLPILTAWLFLARDRRAYRRYLAGLPAEVLLRGFFDRASDSWTRQDVLRVLDRRHTRWRERVSLSDGPSAVV